MTNVGCGMEARSEGSARGKERRTMSVGHDAVVGSKARDGEGKVSTGSSSSSSSSCGKDGDLKIDQYTNRDTLGIASSQHRTSPNDA